MTEYILIAITILIILGTLIHYNKKNVPAKSCNNCRFSDKGLCHNENMMDWHESSSPIKIRNPEFPCKKWWEWNGERDGQ